MTAFSSLTSIAMAALLSAAPNMEEMTVKSKDYEITLDFIMRGLRNGNCVLPSTPDEPEPWGHPIKNSIYSCGGYLLAGQEYTLPGWLPRYEVLNQESVHHYTAIRMNTVNYDYDFAEDCDDDVDDYDTDDDDDGDDSDDEDFEDEYSVDKKDAYVDKGDGENVPASYDDKKYIRDGRGWDDRNNSAKVDDDSNDEGGGKGKDDKCNGKDDEAGGVKDDGDGGGGDDANGGNDDGYDDRNDGDVDSGGRIEDGNIEGNADGCDGKKDGNVVGSVDGGGGNDDGNVDGSVGGGGGNDDDNVDGDIDGRGGNNYGNVDGNSGRDDDCNDDGGSASGRNDNSHGDGSRNDGDDGDDVGWNDERADDDKDAAAHNDDDDGNVDGNVDGGGGKDDGNVDCGGGKDDGNVDGNGGRNYDCNDDGGSASGGNDDVKVDSNGGSDDVCNDDGGSARGRKDDSHGAGGRNGGDDGGGNDKGADEDKDAVTRNDDDNGNDHSKKDPKNIDDFKDGSGITIAATSVAEKDSSRSSSVVALTTGALGGDCDAEKSGDVCMTDHNKDTSIQDVTAFGVGDTDQQTEGNMTKYENIAIDAVDIDARRVEETTRDLHESLHRAMTEFGDLLKKREPVNPLDDTSHGLFGVNGDISDLDVSDRKDDDDKIDDANQNYDVDGHTPENIHDDFQDGSVIASDASVAEKDKSQPFTEVVAALTDTHGACGGDSGTGNSGQISMTDGDKATKIQDIVAATALGGGDINTHTGGNITDDDKMAIAAVDVDDRRVTQTTPDFRELLDQAIIEISSTNETKEPPLLEEDDTAIAVDIADDNSHGLFDIYAEGQTEFQCLQYKPPHKDTTTDIDLSFYRLPFTTQDESLMGILSVYAQGQDAFEFCCTASTDSRGKVDDRPKVVEEDDNEDEGMFAVFTQF